MCTVVLLRRPGHAWPLLVAANRDEMRDRAWSRPDRHWPDRPEVVAGLDHLAQGSWLGLNDHGVVAAVMDRADSLGPAPGKRSRGELVLEALDHAEASEAARALSDLEPGAYRPFNLIIADPVSAFWLSNASVIDSISISAIPEGLHMLTAADLDDTAQPRIGGYLERFRDARTPQPERDRWEAWESLLASRDHAPEHGPQSAMNIELGAGFGTVCSHLLAVPSYPGPGCSPIFRFAPGPPHRAAFERVAL
ncbi:MAG: NRDE family protein [Chromatiales bacterium]|jgi:uncharacterized protein with NRDE domain